MSTEVAGELEFTEGVPELTPLGKRLEILRIERGVSKQRLARHAGTSRQQLWRVMTGKSELTTSLRDRLAAALAVESGALVGTTANTQSRSDLQPAALALVSNAAAPVSLADYLTDARHLAATLRSMPTGDGGRRLKRALLNAVEDLAVESGSALPVDYSEIHRRVLSGEL
jgi:transcriptional regulator with XRE-family HTH domain